MRAGTLAASLLPTILAIAGWNACLPVSAESAAWTRPVQLLPGLFVDDAVLIASFLFATPAVASAIRHGSQGVAWMPAALIVALAAWCSLSGLAGPAPVQDLLESCKLAMNALLLLVLAGCDRRVATRCLRFMLAGMAAGTTVNLAATFASARPTVGSLPMLLGQNGPGTAMGLCVCLAAWLAVTGLTVRDGLIAMTAAAPTTTGAAISYSKIAMTAATAGLASLVVAAVFRASGGARPVLRSILAVVLLAAGAFALTTPGEEVLASLGEFVRLKTASVTPAAISDADATNSSMWARLGYLEGTMEIMESHPLGVGYSGFNAAIRQTKANLQGHSPEELEGPGAASVSNPHATPLYYASAGGWIGLLLVLAAFAALLRCVLTGIGAFGNAGRCVAVASCITYAVIFLSVPTLLRTRLLLGPAGLAVALAAAGERRRPTVR